MSKCELQHFPLEPVGDGPGSVARCTTHGMEVLDYHIKHNQLCPVGKIEAATEEALAKIRAASPSTTDTGTN